MKHLLFILVMAAALCGCNRKTTTNSYYPTTPELLRVEMDGSITLRMFGGGKNKHNSSMQAEKEAVHAVLFDGIRSNDHPEYTRPLCTQVNAREKNRDFFDNFFKDGGKYKQFSSNRQEVKRSKEKQYNQHQMKMGRTVTVYVPELREYLKKKEIIK